MFTDSPLNMPIEEVVYYFRRESPAVGPVFVVMIDALPPGWLSHAEFTDDETPLSRARGSLGDGSVEPCDAGISLKQAASNAAALGTELRTSVSGRSRAS